MAKKIAIRHGDLCLVQIGSLPEGLKPANTSVMMQGSGGNDHAVKDGTVYLKDVDQFVFGYLVAGVNCILLHPDHGVGDATIKTAPIPTGIYELRRQFEHKHETMTQVID
ncbi:MAG: hypothetical protein FD174_2607 [Geobacteraceae bacterium]|nr:MAG: hypothetical protein FD174_2607 [Geobacteraceae bacterium]